MRTWMIEFQLPKVVQTLFFYIPFQFFEIYILFIEVFFLKKRGIKKCSKYQVQYNSTSVAVKISKGKCLIQYCKNDNLKMSMFEIWL